MHPNRLKEQPGRVEIGAAIRAAAALIARLSTPVVLIVLGLNLTEEVVQDVAVLEFLVPLLLPIGATALVVAALVSPEPRGLRPRALRPVVSLALHRLPAAVGAEFVQGLVYLGVSLVVLVILFASGELPDLSVARDTAQPLVIGTAALSTALVARWICALPFVIAQSYGPIAALRASWSATRGSWIACVVLLVAPVLLWYLLRIVAVPLGVPAEALLGTASTIITATIGVAVYRQVTRDIPDLRPVEPVADAERADEVPPAALGKGKTEARSERAAGLILLGLAVLAIAGAASSLVNAIRWRAEEGAAELASLGQLGAVFLGTVGLLFLIAAVGVLRGTMWGRRLGLALSGLFGVLGSLAVVSSPMPWDHSANLGIYQESAAEWLLTLVPVVACWIALVALIRARSVREGIQRGPGQPPSGSGLR